MTTYRVTVHARFYLEIEARDEMEARLKARKLADRLVDGVDVPEVDSECTFDGVLHIDEFQDPEIVNVEEP